MTLTAEIVNRPGNFIDGFIRTLPYPYGSGGKIEGVQDEDTAAHIMLEQNIQDLGMDLGDRMRITVELERAENTLWLPPQAIRSFEGAPSWSCKGPPDGGDWMSRWVSAPTKGTRFLMV